MSISTANSCSSSPAKPSSPMVLTEDSRPMRCWGKHPPGSRDECAPADMNSRARRTTPSVLVFDVNETLIDIESLAPLFGELFGDERVLREGFGQLVMYSMTATLAECYVDFFTLGQGVLHMLADVHRVDVTDDDLHRLQARMRTMPAHPDVTDGLIALRDNGFRLVTLTNSPHKAGMQTPLENGGVTGAPIARPGNPPLPVAGLPQPDLVVSDLRQLAEQLISEPR